jgi:membrane protein DedA with SNARE-associated domain
MNTIRDLILTAAGGMMHTTTLNILTMLVFAILFVVAGVASAYVMAALTAQHKAHMHVDKVTVINDAQ